MSWLSNLFKSGKRDTTYRGPQPTQSLTQVRGGPEYYQTITDRLQGRGVGFGPNYASKYANPIVQNLRNRFESYDIPALTSELSVTGRRRGSGGFDQIRRAYEEQGLTEGDVFSRLQQRDEDQQRNEINDALGRVGDFAANEANLRDKYVASQMADHDAQISRADAERERQGGLVSRAGQAFISLAAAPFTGGGSLALLPRYSTVQSGGNPNVGYGRSGNSLNQRLAQRAALQGGYYK